MASVRRELGDGGRYLRVGFSGVYRYMADVDAGDDFRIVPTHLAEIADAARANRLPFLVHLNGGRWAGGGPLVDALARDPNAMAWDQLNRPWRHLVDGEYHFSLALANQPYRRYKERNLKAAVQWLKDFTAGPDGDLLVGVSTDSEVLLNLHPYADYNPMVLSEFVQWLSGEGPYAAGGRWSADSPGLTRAQVNERYGTRFTKWKDVEPPRTKDGSQFWADWTTFRSLLVDHSVQEQVDWIRQGGLRADQVYSHQGPELNPEVHGDTLAAAQVDGGGLGVTLYGDQAIDARLLASLKTLDPNWGVFEYHPDGQDTDSLLAALDLLRSFGPRIVCPYHWDDLGGPNEVGYTVSGTAFAEALRTFVDLYAEQPVPR